MDERFTAIEDRAEHVLPRLATARVRLQFVYIDGDHRFDSVMLDFTLAARLCDTGAIVVFDDLWMPAIRSAVRYVEANRADWRRVPSPVANAAIFERIGPDERTWNHFVDF
jgi:predicted O-methyltransferase YrrM